MSLSSVFLLFVFIFLSIKWICQTDSVEKQAPHPSSCDNMRRHKLLPCSLKCILVKTGVPLAVPVAPVIKSAASGLGLTFSGVRQHMVCRSLSVTPPSHSHVPLKPLESSFCAKCGCLLP